MYEIDRYSEGLFGDNFVAPKGGGVREWMDILMD
ncbi:MAG: hypothetical protein ACI9QL_003883 [Candidatus Omnitrophota bacterium]|jgi:hypothetical protein